MGSLLYTLGLYRDNGKEHGNYFMVYIGIYFGLYRDNGQERGNYFMVYIGIIGYILGYIGIMEKNMETTLRFI